MWRIIVYPLAAIFVLVLIVTDFYFWSQIITWADHVSNPIIAFSAFFGWPIFQIALGVGFYYWITEEN